MDSLWPQQVKNTLREALAVAAKPSRLATRIDSVIEPAFPGWAARRRGVRTRLMFERMQEAYIENVKFAYTAAQRTRERQWGADAMTSEEALLPGWARFQIIDNARDLYRNFEVIRALVNGISRRAIGTGIRPQWVGSDKAWGETMIGQWLEWCDECDIRGLFDMNALLKQTIRSAYCDGDLGIVFVDGDEIGEYNDGDPVCDLKLQLIESDLIARNQRVTINVDRMSSYTWDHPRIGQVDSWEMSGVLISKQTGAPEGYLVGERGPGGQLVNCEAIPAEDMVVMFRQQRVDQVRGVPLIAPVNDTARDLYAYLNSKRIAANIEASWGAFIKVENPGQYQNALQMAQQASTVGQGFQGWPGDPRMMDFPTGKAWFLRPGEDVTTTTPKQPGSEFDPFTRMMVRFIAIGADYTYEALMQDWAGLNFSQAKGAVTEINNINHEWQRWLVRRFLKRVYPVWCARRMEAGLLEYNEEAYAGIRWQPTAKWGVDPGEESAHNTEMLRTLQTTIEDIYESKGENAWDKIPKQISALGKIKRMAEKEGLELEQVYNAILPGMVKSGAIETPGKEKSQAVVEDDDGMTKAKDPMPNEGTKKVEARRTRSERITNHQ